MCPTMEVRTNYDVLRWLLLFNDPERQIATWLELLSTYNV